MKHKDSSEWNRFSANVEQILSVSHDELQKREKKYQKQRAKNKKRSKFSGASREEI